MGKLLSSVSSRALSIGAGLVHHAPKILLGAGALATTHTGRVILDGVAEGAARGIGEMGDGISGLFNKATGRQASAGPSYSDQMANGYRSALKTVTGSSGPEIRKGTIDEDIHGFAKGAGNIATYLIPVPGGALLKGALKLGAVEARLGGAATRVLSHIPGSGTKIGGTIASSVGHGMAKIPGEIAFSARSATEIATGVAGVKLVGSAYAQPSPDGQSTRPESAAHFTLAASEGRDRQFFAEDHVRQMQKDMGFKGDDIDGVLGRQTANAFDKNIRSQVDPSKISPEQRNQMIAHMRELAQDLEKSPPGPTVRDPRVMEFQVNAYALGLYGHEDGGKMDGLKGHRTESAMEKLAEITAPVPAKPAMEARLEIAGP
ncbi:MAG: hypothetical protein DI586_07580 [Micavibrio aeruginosavorus]|uniref:Uncharacterized protein n=1 Tax=Micavibrio aeruginosavorus TaxID=349221 RepID=A0A2W5HN77_9BACT|nr:MAG: hypothetical protein DI586_07580 [Micavibrio aeruginosavorus]